MLFADDAGLFVSREGGKASLEVAGDEEGKVVFRAEKGEAPGQWAGVEVAPSAGDVSLRHLTIDSAGGFNTSAALDVEEVDIHGTT